jgi:hypothetical protein
MAMSYATLTGTRATAGSIKNWVNRDTTDPDTILTETVALILATLRHWKMKSEVTGNMVVSQDYIVLPADFIDIRDLRITGLYSTRLRKGDERYVQDRYEYDGDGNRVNSQPRWYYLAGGTAPKAKFDNPADQTYPYLLPYYAKPADLSDSNQTNFLTADFPRLVRAGCMLIATEFEKEVGQGQFDRTYWQQQFDKLMGEAQARSDIADMPRELGAEFA